MPTYTSIPICSTWKYQIANVAKLMKIKYGRLVKKFFSVMDCLLQVGCCYLETLFKSR